MKKSPELHKFRTSSQRKEKSHVQYGDAGNSTNRHNLKSHSTLKFIKSATKKVSAIFTIIFLGKRKATSKLAVSDAGRYNYLAREGSSESNYKSFSKFKSFNSFVSSSTSSGQLGTGNFSIEDIYKATEKFSLENKIGEGGFGTVYKGRLEDGCLVAVKRTKKNMQGKHMSEFKNEILTLSKIEHLNLVRLYGYLEHADEQIIIVEYVGNGNLREHLDGIQGNVLEIAERLDIAIDISHAVTYLHMYTDHPIIHRDIKTSNILITEKLRAKVADFGFARLSAEDPGATHISTLVKGTAGYLDPEYVMTFQLTEKSDVYSFGVLLVEMMTGRHPIEPKRPLSERITIRWAMKMLKEGDAILAMDPNLQRSTAANMAVEKVLKLAYQCLAPLRQSRPSMKTCAEVLWGIRKDFREIAISQSSASHHSANFPEKDARKSRRISFEIEDADNYKFISA
ncbi:Receptor-like kinase [Quillaja saponaria]|uniref:non-specific serine/threonine protein kinase n=1 Tax=Quillaja saponaria TaxID=32244 RepID=A0AAD7QJ85_QUISA|nr:Receptor-like kinase [Quillaja saponaria]